MSTPSTPNSNLLAQAMAAAGTQSSSGTQPAPANDITQIPGGALIYAGGGVTSTKSQKRNTVQQPYSGGDAMRETNQKPSRPTTNVTSNTTALQTQSVEKWLNYFYTAIGNSPDNLRKFVTEASLAGLTNTNASQSQAYAAWQKLVVQSYNHTINGQQISPWDVLANSMPVNPTGVGTKKGGGGAGSYANNSGQSYLQGLSNDQVNNLVQQAQNSAADASKKNSVTTVGINYTDPDTARYVLNQASTQLLGRAATNSEISTFTKNLNANEKNFPKKSTSTFTPAPGSTGTGTGTSSTIPEAGSTGTTVVGYDSSGNPIMGPTSTVGGTGSAPGTETTTSLGEADYTRYGRQQLAEDHAKAAPDYGSYQAAGPLFQAFLSALGPAVKGTGGNG
jgi:hypothetical protein